MAIHHTDQDGIDPVLWLNAEDQLIEAVARRLCMRHTLEIWGVEELARLVDERWRSYDCEARDAIAIVRKYDRGNQ